MKWALMVIGTLAAIVTIVWIIGALLPREHVATRMARYAQSPEAIWQAITDAEAMPSWRKDVKSVKRLPEENGMPGWIETMSMGEVPLRVEDSEAPRRLVMRIASGALPFGGTWSYELTPASGGGATLRITEDGFVEPALFRFMARFIFGHTATLEQYVKDLGAKFGEDVTPQP
ncbi:MAG: SRPBCC family protein [Candidatus Acidiferrales bacterium]